MITFAPPPPSPHLRQSRSSTSTTGSSSSTTRSPSPYPFPDQKLHFPNPAVSVISAISHHAKRTCKQLVSVRGHHGDHSGHSHNHEKAPNMAKMRVVTPVYDHGLERWVWPDSARIDEEEEEEDDDEKEWRERRRSRSHGGSFTSSRTSTSS